MKRYISTAVITLIALAPLGAQAPKGWMVRPDRSTNATDPDGAGSIKFATTGSGFHATTPQAAVFWNPANTGSGAYTVKGTFTLQKPSAHTNYYGLVFGGSDLEGAKQGYSEALKIVDQTGYRRGRGYALHGLADVLLSQDQLEAASKIAEEARAIRRDLREDNNLAISSMQLALIRLEQGRLTEPEPLVRTAIDAFERTKMTESNATAYGVLTRILLTQGKLSDAQNAAQRALILSQQTGSRPPRFDAALASARVKAATGKSKDALQNLQGVLAEATKFGYVPYEFEARLAMGEIEMQSGKAFTGRPHLEALEKDARAKGFLLIARKATAAAKVQGSSYK